MEMMDPGNSAADSYSESFYKLLARLVCCPCPVIAAINGHAFAGGFLIAMCADWRVMSDEKGLLCMPEINMQGEVSPGRFPEADRKMMTVFQNKLPGLLVRDIILKGLRWTASEALIRGVVDHSVAPEQVLPTAIQLGQS